MGNKLLDFNKFITINVVCKQLSIEVELKNCNMKVFQRENFNPIEIMIFFKLCDLK